MRNFNVTGPCVPEEDYMVDISGKIEQILKLIEQRAYFTINRGRSFTLQVSTIELGVRYGLIKSVKDSVHISKRIFEVVV